MPYPGAHAATTPDKPAVVLAGSGETLTYAELEDRSTRLAAYLRGLGLRRGDVVALLTDNRPQASEVYWACQRAGLYITAVNWHLTPATSPAPCWPARPQSARHWPTPERVDGFGTTRPHWPAPTRFRRPTSHEAGTCSTAPARQAGRRASGRRCPTGR